MDLWLIAPNPHLAVKPPTKRIVPKSQRAPRKLESGSTEDSVGDGDAGLRIRRSIKERNKSEEGCKTTYNFIEKRTRFQVTRAIRSRL
jgi:hypothetical protein